MNQEILNILLPILAVCQSLSSVFFRMSGRIFHEAGTPMNHLTFMQVQQSFFSWSCMFSLYSIISSSPGKTSFLPKWLTNAIRSPFSVYHPLKVDWLPPGADVSHCHERSKFLKHFTIFCSLWKVWRISNWSISLYI